MLERIKNKLASLQGSQGFGQSMESILAKMGASTRKTVAVSFSHNVGVEMLEIDNISGMIVKYSSRQVAYDAANRKIENYHDFANSLTEMFEEFEISTNSNVVLTLPNINMGLIEVPAMLHGDAIRNVILSEVEQSYVFKSNEPLVSWYNLTKRRDKNNQNTILYSAIQKDVIDGILEACQEVGCRFLTIENSHLSTLRGLSFLGYMKDQFKDNLIWQLMIVEATSFSIITMQGAVPFAYFEEPLAMKSFQDDEIYKAIAASASETVSNRKIKSTGLMIVSQTDLVSAEILKNEFSPVQPIEFLECNKYSTSALYATSYEITPELSEQITLSAIGASAYIFYSYPVTLNYIKENVEELEHIDDQIGNIKVNIGNLELSINRAIIRKLALVVASVMLIPMLIVHLLVSQVFLPRERDKSNSLAASVEAINRQIDALNETNKTEQFDINNAIRDTVSDNKTLLFKYSLLGEVVPKNLYVNHIQEKDKDFLVTGIASSTRLVYEFYKNLKSIMNEENMIVKKLDYTNESLESYMKNPKRIPNALYSFEIASSKEVEKTSDVKSSFNVSPAQELNLADEEEETSTGRITTSAGPPAISAPAPSSDSGSGGAAKPSKSNDAPKKDWSDSLNLPRNLKKIENF